MCGISGFIDKKNLLSERDRNILVKKMLQKIRHRGSKKIKIKSAQNISVGHTRLVILDRARGVQPCQEGGQILAFNGEIYNHRQLRKRYLSEEGIDSYSDTATLFSLLKKYSFRKVLDSIEGMFAFSVWDGEKKNLMLALDRFAIKPLYYVNTPRFFAWASELKAFEPIFKFKINEESLGEYLLFGHAVGNQTLFKNIFKLQAGECVTFSFTKNSLESEVYYLLPKKESHRKFNEQMLALSVREHLMGDEEPGIQLSGGLDSSLVAYYAQKNTEKKLHTFSIGLRDKKWNEFEFSDRVAKTLGTAHHKIYFSPSDFKKLLKKVTYYLDEPIVHPNTVPMYILAMYARKFTKVLLTGEGADEVFCGYKRYFKKKTKDILTSNTLLPKDSFLEIFKKDITLNRRSNFIQSLKKLSGQNRISLYDLYTYLPHVLLRQDRAGMGANIENRVPFLKTDIVESGINLKHRFDENGGKIHLKKIAAQYFDKDLVLRKKCGFGLPISEWLKDKRVLLDLVIDLPNKPAIIKYFHIGRLKQLIKEHTLSKKDHSALLFRLIGFYVWYDNFILKS